MKKTFFKSSQRKRKTSNRKWNQPTKHQIEPKQKNSSVKIFTKEEIAQYNEGK